MNQELIDPTNIPFYCGALRRKRQILLKALLQHDGRPPSMESFEPENTNSIASDALITRSGVNPRMSTGDFAKTRVANSGKESPEPIASRSDSKSRVEKHIEMLTDEQVETRQISKNRYTELEAWPLYQLFFEYPQLFLGVSALGTTLFLLMLHLNFFVAVILSATTPYVLFRLWKYNPKVLMISLYSLTGIVAVVVAIFFQLELKL